MLSQTALDEIRARHNMLPARGGSADIAALLAHVADTGPRVVETLADLDALPTLTVIREIRRPSPSGHDYGLVWERYHEGKWRSSLTEIRSDAEPVLPAVVLYTPEAL